MFDQIIENTKKQAEEYYSCAEEGLFKPEEDVVNYMVCKCAFRAAYNFLALFLLKNKIETHTSDSLETLLNKSQNINPAFRDLNLDILYHPMEEEDVWMDIETSKTFMSLAQKTRDLVLSVS